jgi:hypothetical protein
VFRIIVINLAIRIWDKTIPDPEDFERYLAENPVLDAAVTSANDYESYLRCEEAA